MAPEDGERAAAAKEARPASAGGGDGPTGAARHPRATVTVAVAFGAASVPWTYAFVAGLGLPLWPSFVAAASFSAAGGGADGLVRSVAGNLAGVGYAAATLAVVAAGGGGPVALSFVVGAFMLAASLHALLPVLSFAPAAFLGYATLFGVHASGATASGTSGLGGEVAAAVVAMLLGAAIGLAVERSADRLAGSA